MRTGGFAEKGHEEDRCRHYLVVAGEPHSLSAMVVSPGAAMALLASVLYAADHLPKLSGDNFARGHLALRLRVHLPGPPAPGMSCVRRAAATDGAVLSMWCHG